uniref:Uncharacterized protein n=1 Tax=Thermogemmatispora argillosa TaxID=2045280 RepID=A0A455SYX0_9CHLR|nr:hypothetical protein KTA_02810 [Thermogemmatispora argillosa]
MAVPFTWVAFVAWLLVMGGWFLEIGRTLNRLPAEGQRRSHDQKGTQEPVPGRSDDWRSAREEDPQVRIERGNGGLFTSWCLGSLSDVHALVLY